MLRFLAIPTSGLSALSSLPPRRPHGASGNIRLCRSSKAASGALLLPLPEGRRRLLPRLLRHCLMSTQGFGAMDAALLQERAVFSAIETADLFPGAWRCAASAFRAGSLQDAIDPVLNLLRPRKP